MGGNMMGGMQMGGNSKKTQGNRLAGEDESKMLVSNKAASAIIGKGAQTLKNLRESYGCRVEVLGKDVKTARFADERIVILQGPLAARQQAACAVLQLAYPE